MNSINQLILDSIDSALQAANPFNAVQKYLQLDGDKLIIADRCYNLGSGDLRCIAVGKAAVPMAQAVADLLGDRISTGLVVTTSADLRSAKLPNGWESIEAGHPQPDSNSLRAGDRVWNILNNCTEHTMIIACISGGASALLAAPKSWNDLEELLTIDRMISSVIATALISQGIDIYHPIGETISLRALQTINQALLNSGDNIQQINKVRAKLDRLKAGGLVRRAAPGQVIGLILSDVIGDPLESIASGLTNHPKAHNTLVGNNRQSCLAIARTAEKLGYEVEVVTTELAGEARLRGVEIALEIVNRQAKTVLIYGGETTVTIPPDCQGKGGRNQELALAAAIELSKHNIPATVVTLATDGIDGPTDAAGATVNEQTIDRSSLLGLDAVSALDRHDSYPFFHQLGNLHLIGATGTNVADITIAIRP